MGYDKDKISKEIDLTISGKKFYGNSLLVAKDFPVINPEERTIIDRLLVTYNTKKFKKNLEKYKHRLEIISKKIKEST